MMIPTDSPGAARAAAVAQERKGESGAAEPAEFIRHARRGSDAPARARRARRIVRLVAEQQPDPAAVARGEREPPRRGEVRRRAKLRHHGRDRAAFQRLLHGKQRIDRARHARNQEPPGIEPELIEPRAIKRAGLERAEIGRDPERLLARFARQRRQRDGEAHRGAGMAGRRAQLMQGRAGQAAAERRIDPGAERARTRFLGKRFAGRNPAPQARNLLLHRLGWEHGGYRKFMVCSY